MLIDTTAWYTANVPMNDAQVAAHFNSEKIRYDQGRQAYSTRYSY